MLALAGSQPNTSACRKSHQTGLYSTINLEVVWSIISPGCQDTGKTREDTIQLHQRCVSPIFLFDAEMRLHQRCVGPTFLFDAGVRQHNGPAGHILGGD